MKQIQKKRKRDAALLRWSRIAVQIIFFIAAPALFAQGFSGAKEIFTAFGQGQPLAVSVFVIRLVILCVVTVVFGRIFCGWVCAFGALGDWLYLGAHGLAGKFGRKLPVLPDRILHLLQKGKYLICVLVLGLCFSGRSAYIVEYSPWTVFSLITAGNFALTDYVGGGVLLLLILVGMIVQERFFCQCLCPMGALFSLLPENPLLSMKRDSEHCIAGCQLCRNNCPVRIKVQENARESGECIRCGRCMQGCPRGNIHLRSRKNKS